MVGTLALTIPVGCAVIDLAHVAPGMVLATSATLTISLGAAAMVASIMSGILDRRAIALRGY